MPALEWIGKRAVVRHHLEVPYRILEPVPELSFGEGDNLLVEGDNLEALKALLPQYRGRVKLVYIDPPYNTGNEGWVYNDNVNSPEIRDWLGKVVGPEAEDLSRHDKWLSMMYPRLRLLHELLREDGSLWMSIDDNEVHRARMLLDEIFGPQNFVATLIWQKKYSTQNDAIYFSDMHDYILVYAKRKKSSRGDPAGWSLNKLPPSPEKLARYKNPDNDPRGPWKMENYTCAKTREERPNLYYPIVNPNTGEEIWPSPTRVWAFSREEHERHLRENRIWWGKDGRGRPNLKSFLSEVQATMVPTTLWLREDVGDTQEARREVRQILEGEDFPTPKPTRLLQRILQIATNPHDGDIVLDSFAGSGTTGHAVLKQNAADGGNRRFILVELDPHIAQNITRRRLEYAAREHGSGFQYLRLGETLFTPDGRIREGVDYLTLARYVYYRETGEPLPSTISPPLLGVSQRGVAVYLLYNGEPKDRSPKGGNALTREVLAHLPPHDGPKVVYGTSCRLSPATLTAWGITFRHIPYEVAQ